jgi:hypothetical protein
VIRERSGMSNIKSTDVIHKKALAQCRLVWLKPLASCDDVVVVGASVLTVATEDEAMVHEAEGRGKETLVGLGPDLRETKTITFKCMM